MDSVNLRNLEQIREHEARPRAGRLGALVMASVAGAAIVVGLVAASRRSGPARTAAEDPLAQLATRQPTVAAAPDQLERREVTFPNVLSDATKPTTALAVVRDERGRLLAAGSASPLTGAEAALPLPPGIEARPLPAGDLLSATTVTQQPKDDLTRMAVTLSKVPDDAELVSEGKDGGFQLQVASFRSAEDADSFVKDLRKRGHHAYRQAAYVPDRGLWHRVRVGPFKTKFEAVTYRSKLEKAEKIAGFVIDPERQRRAAEDRESGLSNREHRRPKKDDT